MTNSKNDLLLFFDRPREPCFLQKGENTIFQLPEEYYPEKYKKLSGIISNRFGKGIKREIPVRKIALPNLEMPMELPYNSQFSLFIPRHRQIAGKLIDIFINMRNIEELISICSYCQLRINPYMFNYCLTVALLHRPDTKGLSIPTLTQTFPDKFVDPKVFNRMRTEASMNMNTNVQRMPVVIPRNFTASDAEPEQRLAYFREDIGINLHHWHWHLVYPAESANREIVAKDRRGELLYYMHQQIIARYNIERFCNDLPRVVPFGANLRETIKEAYFPKLNSVVSSRTWQPRFENSVMQDIDRPIERIKLELSEMERWRDRILQAIDSNSILLPNGTQMPLDEEKGIDILGDLMEASILTPNRAFYGDFHNMGHTVMSYIHDPDHRYLELFGVMGDPSTTMRDPLFYRWHGFVDDVFVLYKNKLPPYANDKLDFPGIRVSSLSVEGKAGKNTFATQWEQSTVELGRGMDFFPRGSVLATFTHLQHDEFDYVFENSVMQDLDRPVEKIKLELSQMEMWRDRILQAIDSNSILLPNGKQMPLDEEKGIDILGDLMEASILTPNRAFYGDFHNMGHTVMSYIHDPDHRYLELFGVMGDPATTMRDPLFYRWHGFVDDVFVLYKNKLPPYTNDKLDFPGIRVSSLSVEGKAGKNIFATQWEQSTVELGRGMDFFPRGSVLATFTHLKHDEFDYVIEVENSSGKKATGTVRIFLAPITDEKGNKLAFNDQRKLMIELDKFSQDLAPGKNTIRRASIESSVTIPYERTFMDQTKRSGDPGSKEAAEFDFCGCGWPHHMLLPKGTQQRYPMILFVMVSNWADDAVIQDLVGTCKDAASYCGIRDRKYPDKRAMGFPFDRPVPAGVQTVKDFLKPNMAVIDCKIRFTDTVRVRGAR
ncbi:Phenoloxidase subunit 1 [Papilio machaon]|uniref:Phenoloxidase subunit 1 n=1 Tax=Papilio machaon TaxID=76193 RepID=A0A0N0PCD7_PAPMA|nr:Phenoloxidase subunit 1 [Papilio machaon]